MEGNFSNRVRDVISYSREEAIRLGHDYIGTEHLLLGIIREGEGIAVKILRNLGCDLFKLKKAVEDTVRSTGGTLTVGNIPLTKQAEKVLKITYLEAKLYKSDVIGTEHLLLSLLRDDENVAAQILQQAFSVNHDAVRAALDSFLSGKASPRAATDSALGGEPARPAAPEATEPPPPAKTLDRQPVSRPPRLPPVPAPLPPGLDESWQPVDIVGLSTSPSEGGAYALVLGEVGGDRRLPIIIGAFEAQAIALELENIAPPRPMTHDLFLDTAGLVGGSVRDVKVLPPPADGESDAAFHAAVRIWTPEVTTTLDARPSDAVAIAVRFKVPIYVLREMLETHGVASVDAHGAPDA